jgi:hypothetical protein
MVGFRTILRCGFVRGRKVRIARKEMDSPLCRTGYCSRFYRLKTRTDMHFTLEAIFFLFLCVHSSGCRSRMSNDRPSIEFSKIPPAAKGGRERVDTIAGRVIGRRPGQQIVVYAKSGPWWVQPWPDQPFIPIQSDSTWSTTTHLGYEYAALLVDPGYHPRRRWMKLQAKVVPLCL